MRTLMSHQYMLENTAASVHEMLLEAMELGDRYVPRLDVVKHGAILILTLATFSTSDGRRSMETAIVSGGRRLHPDRHRVRHGRKLLSSPQPRAGVY